MAYLNNRKWQYSCAGSSASWRTNRVGVTYGLYPELEGVDLREQGGFRLHPGFKNVHRLGAGTRGVDDTANPYTVMDLKGFFSATLRVGASRTVTGWVTRVRKTGDPDYTLVFEFWDTLGVSTAMTPTLDVWRSIPLKTGVAGTGQMDVVVFGRLLYVFIENERPLRFFIDEDTGDYTPNIELETGPGAKHPAANILASVVFRSRSVLEPPAAPVIPLSEFPPIPSSPEEESATFDPRDVFEPGSYNIAVQFEDSKTGLVSQLSELREISKSRFRERIPFRRDENGDVVYEAIEVPKSVRLRVTGINRDKWDRMRIFRSVGVSAPGTEDASTVLYLNEIVDLPGTSGTVTFPSTGHYGDNNDDWLPTAALVLQELYPDKTQFLEKMPSAGAAHLYGGSLFIGKGKSEEDDSQSGVGEIRFSSSMETSPELFPPDNRNPTFAIEEDVLRFVSVADTIVGLSPSRMYEIMRSGPFIAIRPTHKGFGVAGPRAATTSGPTAYVLSRQGMLAVDSGGELTLVNALTHLVNTKWAGTLSEVRIVNDAATGTLCVLNPTLERMVLMWGLTQSLSELRHTSFVDACEGIVPNTSGAEERAMFVLGNGQVVIFDSDRTKNIRCLMDVQGGSVNTSVSSIGAFGFSLQTITVAGSTHASWVGTKLVFSSGGRRGSAYTILSVGTGTVTVATSSDLTPLAQAGDGVAISPVYFGLIGWTLGLLADFEDQVQINAGSTVNFTRGRILQSVGCAFEGVSGAGATSPNATFYAQAYVGLETTPRASQAPRSPALGTGTQPWAHLGAIGVRDGAVFPGLDVICSDVDFTLIGFTAQGNISSSENAPR